MSVPRLAHGVRLRRGDNGQGILLIPEGVVNLNQSATAILELVDGVRSVDAIAGTLSAVYIADKKVLAEEVQALLDRMAAKMWLAYEETRAKDMREHK